MPGDEADLTALQVAIAAGVLMVALVGVDVVFNAAASLQVATEDGWRTIGQIPTERDRFAQRPVAVDVNRSDTLDFRIVVDNQRPIGYSESYTVDGPKAQLDEGTLTADAMGTAEQRFQVAAEALLGPAGGPEHDLPRPAGAPLRFTVGEETVWADLDLREVAR